jgi:hypothetical protein
MSKLKENKQMIHIASEIVALVGLTFYFNQKNKKLMGHIENLAQKIEEQEDLLQKHEHIIKKMLEFMNDQNTPQVLAKQLETTKIRKKPPPPAKEVHTKPPLKVPTPSKPESTKVSFSDQIFKTTKIPPIRVVESEESTDSEESDLDAELAEELEELEIEEEINLTDLKKRV